MVPVDLTRCAGRSKSALMGLLSVPESMLARGSCSRDISAAMAFGCVRLDGHGLRSEAALSLSGGVSRAGIFSAFASARTVLGVTTRELVVPSPLGADKASRNRALQLTVHFAVSLLLEALQALDRGQAPEG
jgi:hypothetical protein